MKRPMNPSESIKPQAPAPADEQPPKDASNWIAEVSHELRLPIANIRLLVETLLDGALEDPEVSRRMLKRAFSEVERLQMLVRDLLSVEQVSQSRQDLKYQWIDLRDRSKYAAESIATMAMAKGVKVDVKVASGFKVYANQEQLDQVLLNLLENAVKFTSAGGCVTVRSGAEPGSFSVTDTGVGISAAEIPKIFQRFYRVDRSRSKGSTGLGLSIVKHIVDLHGASVNVESEEGVGSTFFLHFPAPR